MSKFNEGDRVIAATAFYGDVKAHLEERDSNGLWVIQIENPERGTSGKMVIHEVRLRPWGSDSKLAGKIVRKLETIRKHREEMLEEFKELRELLVEDGQEDYELRKVDEFSTVIKHTLNHELLYLLSNWENARDYRAETEQLTKEKN